MPDELTMPFGKYKGQPMSRIPSGYLIYLYDNKDWLRGKPREYIEQNLDRLRKESEAYRLRKEQSSRA